MSNDIAKDPDDAYGDEVIAAIEIKWRRNGAMSTGGCIGNKEMALAMLDAARDAVIAHHKRIENGRGVLIPGKDCPPVPENTSWLG